MYHLLTKPRLITLAISSFCLFIFSICVAFLILPLVINLEIDKNIQLVRGTDQWHRFQQLPFNISFNITFFEVSNAESVIEDGSTPILKERGPYIFDEIIKKEQISYNDDEDTISYKRSIEFYFNELRSGSDVSFDDNITLINPVYLGVMQLAKDISIPLIPPATLASLIQKCLNAMFEEQLLLTVSVRNLLFDGIKICDYSNSACKVLFVSLCPFFLGITKLIEEVTEGDEHYLKFSFLNYKVIESDGTYEVQTGIADINDVGNIIKWNNETYTDFWVQGLSKNSCDFVTGTDGTMFPPHVTEETVISVYSTDICRNAKAYYDGVGTHKGIEGLKFKASPSLFYSSCTNSSEDCFCDKNILDVNGEETCFLDGVMDFSPCYGVPVVFSYPHFLYADPKYLETLEGDISPDEEKHELYMLIDKYTGIPLRAHKRVQMNMISRPVDNFEPLSSNLPRTVLPLLWMDEGIDLPDSGIELLDSLLYDTLTLVNILKWVFIGITLGLTILSGILLLHRFSFCKKQ